jgi:integrase
MSRLTLLVGQETGSLARRDRAEILHALIAAPTFDARFRDDVIDIEPGDPVFGWACMIEGCRRAHASNNRFCGKHHDQWKNAAALGTAFGDFFDAAKPIAPKVGAYFGQCRICVIHPASCADTLLCARHRKLWNSTKSLKVRDFDLFLSKQSPFADYGICSCDVCPYPACTPLGLCSQHRDRYNRDDQPGGASLQTHWAKIEKSGHLVKPQFSNRRDFEKWCSTADPVYRLGVLNLSGLRPLVKAEFKWGLNAHAHSTDPSRWDLCYLQRLVNIIRGRGDNELADYQADGWVDGDGKSDVEQRVSQIGREIINGLRTVYFSPSDTKDAGFIETDHFGRRFRASYSTFDLTGVPQRWLRDLLWDHLAELLKSPKPPRTRGVFDSLRRSCVELGTYLEITAPQGGHDPQILEAQHAQAFVADQRDRELNGKTSLALVRKDGKPSIVTTVTRRIVFNHIRQLLNGALQSGRADEIPLSRAFIVEFPAAGPDPHRARSPFSDDVARVLVDEENLERFAAVHDRYDRGLRDIWEVIVATGRRCGEVLQLRLDCIGRYGGLALLWHDQTKVGKYDQAIRIPESIYALIERRQTRTLSRFERLNGRMPTPEERRVIALFPSNVRNASARRSISYGHFSRAFNSWVEALDLPGSVPHQARHTLATNLLRAGASLAHIRRYLGQVSSRMAERYIHVAQSDLEDVLQTVWVAGPASASPGKLLSEGVASLSKEQATAMAIDLSRRSTPSEGGFCTFQPVVSGEACPWNLNCHGCDKFVMSGADLLYWRRKREQWSSIAERAPDPSTADYLHRVFEPTARAIAGLEKALAGLGLLEQALAMDLRRPQDYFQRIWSTNFSASALAARDEDGMGADRKSEP